MSTIGEQRVHTRGSGSMGRNHSAHDDEAFSPEMGGEALKLLSGLFGYLHPLGLWLLLPGSLNLPRTFFHCDCLFHGNLSELNSVL
jgi:hypothetical protein